jgi:hypothetical protein
VLENVPPDAAGLQKRATFSTLYVGLTSSSYYIISLRNMRNSQENNVIFASARVAGNKQTNKWDAVFSVLVNNTLRKQYLGKHGGDEADCPTHSSDSK